MRLSMMWKIKQIEENVIGHYDLLDSSDTALLRNVWRSESAQKRQRSMTFYPDSTSAQNYTGWNVQHQCTKVK